MDSADSQVHSFALCALLGKQFAPQYVQNFPQRSDHEKTTKSRDLQLISPFKIAIQVCNFPAGACFATV